MNLNQDLFDLNEKPCITIGCVAHSATALLKIVAMSTLKKNYYELFNVYAYDSSADLCQHVYMGLKKSLFFLSWRVNVGKHFVQAKQVIINFLKG